jgi:hypothetical protein
MQCYDFIHFRMPAPQFGISPGLSILPAKYFHNMAYIRGRKRKRTSHRVGMNKVGGRRRRQIHKQRRRRRRRKIHQIPVHPLLS